jgi:hypothetical protein
MYKEGKNHATLYGGMFFLDLYSSSVWTYSGLEHCGFPQSLQANNRTTPKFGHDHLIQNLS